MERLRDEDAESFRLVQAALEGIALAHADKIVDGGLSRRQVLDLWDSRAKELTVAHCRADPLFHDYFNEFDSGEVKHGPKRHRLPKHALGQRLDIVERVADGTKGDGSVWRPGAVPAEEKVPFSNKEYDRFLSAMFSAYSLRATTYLLRDKPLAIIEELPPIPDHKVSAKLPVPAMFVSLETPYYHLEGSQLNCLLLAELHDPGSDTMEIVALLTPDGDSVESNFVPYHVHHGARYPQDFDGDEEMLSLVRFVLRFRSFIESRIPVIRRKRLHRTDRRRAERAGITRSILEENANVIDLRARNYVNPKKDHESAPVDWSGHWIVRSHWRNQWYPSLGVHKPVLVPPYVKGDTSKPLIRHVYDVKR